MQELKSGYESGGVEWLGYKRVTSNSATSLINYTDSLEQFECCSMVKHLSIKACVVFALL